MRKQNMMYALAIGVGLTASAADFQWNATGDVADWGAEKVWLHMGKTPPEPFTWTGNQVAIFPEDANLAHTVNLEKSYTPGRMNVKDDYTFTGADASYMQYDLGYSFWVSAGKTATLQVPLRQANSDPDKRVIFEPTGTIDLQKGGEVYRFQLNKGTVKVTGGTLKTTGSDIGASAAASVAGFTAGTFIVDGANAKVEIGEATKYVPNSGTEIVVRNDGAFDASKVEEVLNGFSNNGTNSSHASITVMDGGTFIADKLRIGKANKTTFDAKPDYARVNVLTGGVMSVHQMRMDDTGEWYGEVNFNGGTWELTCIDSEKGKEIYPFSTDPTSLAKYPWAGLRLMVRKGGARLKNTGDVNYRHKILHPLECGVAAGEIDGGLTIEGTGLLYMNATNTFNGPTILTGSGGVIYVPRDDRALGAVPDKPTTNIIAKGSGPILHIDYACEIHSNRNVWIAKNTTMKIGNSQKMTLKGTIKGEDKTSVLNVTDSWDGSLALAPVSGRVSEIGRIVVNGKMLVEDGVTKIMNVANGVDGNAALYVARPSTATAFSEKKGVLEVTGGTLQMSDTAHKAYVQTSYYGQLRVSGGTLEMSEASELLNALRGPGRTEVSGTGRINAYTVRVSQTPNVDGNGEPLARIHVATGGVLRLHHFTIDANASQKGYVDLDGGTLEFRSSRDNVFGPGTTAWAGIHYRACAGGAIINTMKLNIGVQAPIESGVASGRVDGGLTKKGTGTLTMKVTNTYTGPTRCDEGNLVFETDEAFPGGDLAVSAKALKANGSLGTIKSPKLVFKPGAKVRIVEADGVDPKTCNRVTIATSEAEIVNPPSVAVVVDKDGNVIPGGVEWRVSLSPDRRTLQVGKAQGCAIIVR